MGKETLQQLIAKPNPYHIMGIDDISLAEFPFFSVCSNAAADNKQVITHERQLKSQAITQQIIVEASPRYGMPNIVDADVLLAILAIGNEQWARKQGPIDPSLKRIISFSRYRLCRVMQWDISGKSYKRIDEAHLRWQKTNIEVKNWYDSVQGAYRTEGFSFFNSARFYHRADGYSREGELPYSVAILSEEFLAMIENGFTKEIDLGLYFSLKKPTAKQAFRFLDKRLRPGVTQSFDLTEFAINSVGLTEAPATLLKQRLRPAIAELEERGVIAPLAYADRFFKRGRGSYEIQFTGVKRRPSLFNAVALALVNEGVSERTAIDMASSFPEETIREKIEILHWLIDTAGQKAPGNPAGWLVDAVRNNYDRPKGFQSYEDKAAIAKAKIAAEEEHYREKAKERRQRELFDQEKREQREEGERRWRLVEEKINALPDRVREEMINAAIEAEGDFIAQVCRRSRSEGGGWDFGSTILREAIQKHLSGSGKDPANDL